MLRLRTLLLAAAGLAAALSFAAPQARADSFPLNNTATLQSQHFVVHYTADYQAATEIRMLWTRDLGRVLRRVNALVTPTLAIPAFPVEVQLSEAGPPDTGWATRHFNLSGHPALTLPCGATAAGLPVGMQLAGRAFDESTLFRIAHAYEEATPWHTRRPSVKEAV